MSANGPRASRPTFGILYAVSALTEPVKSERAIVFCVGAVQFVNILDFMIVMPLGPDFATGLGIPLSQLGYIGGSYTAAASISGIAGAFFLDRFDRKRALVVALTGLTLGTMLGAFAQGIASLMAARMIAGAFGGPATSLSYSIIADVIPPARRGRAMGAVMGAFSVASILGVPAGLELSRQGGWRLPFIGVAILGGLISIFARFGLPSMTKHLEGVRRSAVADLRGLLRRDIYLSLAMTFVVMAASFVIIPNISAYLLQNLGYPRARLGLLYFAGGLVSFVAMRVVGMLVDKLGSAPVGTVGTLGVAGVIYVGFVRVPPPIPIMLMFVLFMLAMAFRNVSYNTLASRVPRPAERARFGSVQSCVQHLAAALGAFTSAQLLGETADHRLTGVDRTAWVSIVLALFLPPMLLIVERRVQAQKPD